MIFKTGSWPRTALAAMKRFEAFRPRMAGGLTVGLGDSITAGHTFGPLNIAANDSYFDVLACRRVLGATVNRGWAGQTSAQIHARLPEVLALSPVRVLVLAGTNDVHLDSDIDTIATLDAIRADIEASGASVAFGLLPPQDRRPDQVRAMNARIAVWAESAGVPLFDTHTPAADADGRWRAGLSGDGLHPTREGARVLADAAQRVISTGLLSPQQ